MTYRLATYHGPSVTYYAIGPNGPVAEFSDPIEAAAWIAERNADPGSTHAVTLDTVSEPAAPQRPTLQARLAQTLRFIQGNPARD